MFNLVKNNLGSTRSNYSWHDHPTGKPLVEEEVYVLFVNTTNRTIDLYWTREKNRENIRYTLKPKDKVPINTYNTHIWFFRDYYTGERMHVRSKRLFYPVRIRIPRNPDNPEELSDVRSQILIHFPLRTLKENCLCLIAKWLRRTCDRPKQYVRGYAIPATLKDQLLDQLRTMEVYMQEVEYRSQRIEGRN